MLMKLTPVGYIMYIQEEIQTYPCLIFLLTFELLYLLTVENFDDNDNNNNNSNDNNNNKNTNKNRRPPTFNFGSGVNPIKENLY